MYLGGAGVIAIAKQPSWDIGGHIVYREPTTFPSWHILSPRLFLLRTIDHFGSTVVGKRGNNEGGIDLQKGGGFYPTIA